MIFRALLAIFVAGLCLNAQTSVAPAQIQTPATTEWRVLAFNSAGQLVQLKLAPGLTIDSSTSTITATQTAPATTPVLEVKHQRLIPLSSGEYPAMCDLSSIITRNGLVMTLTEDYDIGASIRPKTPWPSTDLVTCFSVTVKPTP